MAPDQINGMFEALGAVFILRHCRAVWLAKASKGVDIPATVFFTAWGAWNLFYYPSLNQPYSFCGGALLVLANGLWVGLLVRFSCPLKKSKIEHGRMFSDEVYAEPTEQFYTNEKCPKCGSSLVFKCGILDELEECFSCKHIWPL
jgi:hypothetical protein